MRFKKLGEYLPNEDASYQLLPFRFERIDQARCAIVNMVGEHLIVTHDDLSTIVGKGLRPRDSLYHDLKSKHFIQDTDSDLALDLLALKLRTKHGPVAEFTSLHIFVVSLRCEHSCPYCQVSRRSDDKQQFDMSEETAFRALELVFRSPSPSVKIEFQGGEPLLNFDLVKWTVLRAKQINETARKHLEFVVATNLALVTEEVLAFCRLHDVHISTSLDGPSELHNRNRPRPGRDSYERTVSGIMMARKALGKDRVSALMTTTAASLDRVEDIVDEYIRQDFDGIFLRPLSPYGFAVKTGWYNAYDEDRWLAFYKNGLEYIIGINRSGYRFVEYYSSVILSKMLSPFSSSYVDLASPAGIGIAAAVYNYDGDVYASDESRMLAEMGDKTFRLGNVTANTYEEIFTSDALLEPLESSFAGSCPQCSDCAFETSCGADPVFHYRTQGDFIGKKPFSAFCLRHLSMSKHLISLLQEPEARKVLLSWVR